MDGKKENIKRRIFKEVAEFYKVAHASKKFVPGKSRLPYASRVFDENELINLVDSSLEFWLTHGRFSERFEKTFAEYIGVNHCLMVNSGSSANLLAVAALASPLLGKRRLVPGDEIITVAAGFPTTVAPIIQYGFVPVFVDVTIPFYNIDCEKLEAAISPRTKAIMLAHTLGNPFDVEKVRNFCKKYNLWLIEDNCDSLGSRYKGKLTGTFGDIGSSSFYPPHHITTGEGGAVYTNNPVLTRILLSLRDWGRDCTCPSGKDNRCGKRFSQKFGKLPFGYDHKYIYSHFGYNLKASDMQAAIGCAQLEKLPFFIKKRKDNFNFLYGRIKHLENKFILPCATENSDPCWFGFILTVRKGSDFSRNDIVEFLEKKLIQTRMLFAGNLVRQPCFEWLEKIKRNYRIAGDLKNTDYIMKNAFLVGLYPGMKKNMLSYIADQIESFTD